MIKLVNFVFFAFAFSASASDCPTVPEIGNRSMGVEDVHFFYLERDRRIERISGSTQTMLYGWYRHCDSDYLDLYYFSENNVMAWHKSYKLQSAPGGIGALIDYNGGVIITLMDHEGSQGRIMIVEQSGRHIWSGQRLDSWNGVVASGPNISSKLAAQMSGKRLLGVDADGYFVWADGQTMSKLSFPTVGRDYVILAYGVPLSGRRTQDRFDIRMEGKYVPASRQ